ncbi:hypothetical protein RJT34_24173 [Clitoria ternatea]|uniref:Uncharacterized protein n=1 Tax=Clitoria ternatea TaxID=43366 RepID=A0AAN9IFM6_CLITE
MPGTFVSMFLQKLIFAAMVVVLLSVGVRSKTICPGTCKTYPNCEAYCKSRGYDHGGCVPPQNYFCCCSKYDQQTFNNIPSD